MLLGSLSTIIFGVWARLAPGFIASPPARPRRLLSAVALWMAGAAGLVADVPLAGLPVLAGLCALAWALGVFGPSIARQPLPGHARTTRLAVRSAFVWALLGAALLAIYQLPRAAGGSDASYLEVSAARHSFALGFVTMMIYGVAARALPSFTDRQLWSPRLQLLTIALANAGVALRVAPQPSAGRVWSPARWWVCRVSSPTSRSSPCGEHAADRARPGRAPEGARHAGPDRCPLPVATSRGCQKPHPHLNRERLCLESRHGTRRPGI
ncbi:MAG: hypothetical protein M3P38_00365 [Chloroflexota bacterium]|nr:hypothetical protein [Chloroflexota bacterium]